MKPTVNVLYLPGTNCQDETFRAFAQAGAAPRILFLSELLSGEASLDSADILCIAGGFSFGDHLGAGAIGGLLLKTKLRDQFVTCQDRPILCICNGFQIALRAGCFGPDVALKINSCGTFRDVPNQAHVVVPGNDSPWLAGLGGAVLEFPCAHGEGRFVHRGKGDWRTALLYPEGDNPNGSMDHIAGITTGNGLLFGLMNHPERAADPHVRLAFIENGVRAAC